MGLVGDRYTVQQDTTNSHYSQYNSGELTLSNYRIENVLPTLRIIRDLWIHNRRNVDAASNDVAGMVRVL